MPDDYFEDSAPPGGSGTEGSKPPAEDQPEGGRTFLVNKEAYPDAKPGDVFKMRVEQVHDDEMSCSIEKDGEPESGPEEPAEQTENPATPPGMMD